MSDSKKAEETAVNRVQMLAPLMEQGLDTATLAQMKQEICERYGISDRTLRRYLAQYREEGFAGLKPRSSGRPGARSIPLEVLKEAILLRREVPKRSVRSIIQILEWEKKIAPGSVSRSTLQDHLTAAGYSSAQMRIYRSGGVAARRFQRSNRNDLWQSDIKFGPYINGKQVYLAAFIDDCTRYVLHAKFYPVLDQSIVEDAFRQSLHKYGAPKAAYFDNGKQYRTKVMERSCAKLNIRLLYTRPYAAFNTDKEMIRFLDAEEISDAFLRVEQRKVDKAGCISFDGRKYELEHGLKLIGRKVDVIYDASDTDTLWIEHEGFLRFTAKPLVIGERAGQRPVLPPGLLSETPLQSRLLSAAEKEHETRKRNHLTAISFRGIGGVGDV